MSGNYFDQFDETPKKENNFFDQFDEEDTPVPSKRLAAKPFTGRGTIAARNKAAEAPMLGERGSEFRQFAAIDAATTPALGTAEARAAFPAEVARRAGEIGVPPTAGGASPEVRAAMERVAPSGQLLPLLNNPGVIAAKFKAGWRGADAGAALLEYNTTGRVTIGGDSGDALDRYADGGGPTYLEGAAAEKYIRDLASPNADDATSAAFDSVSPMGTRAAANALAQPESILSLAGGMAGGGMGSAAGMLPTAFKVMGSEYLQNLRNGASHEAALANAIAKMGVEAGTEWLGGKYGGEGGAVRSIVSEGVEEGVAQIGGYGVDAVSGALADNSAAFYEKIPKTFGEGLSQTAEAVATGGIAAGALRAITAAPALALSGVEAAHRLFESKKGQTPTAVPRAPAGPIPVDPWTTGPAATAVVPPATTTASTTPTKTTTSKADPLVTQLMTPQEKAQFDKLKDPVQRRAMIDSADERRVEIQAVMAANAADREWVSKNDITTHPAFAAIDAAVRGGATSQSKLKEQVPTASRIIQKAAIDHLEKAGVVSPPDAQNRRKVLAPLMPNNATVTTDALKGNNDSAIQPSVQDAIQPAVQDNVVEQKNSVTLPEVGRIIARESEDVNTPAPTQTETVQTTAPVVAPVVETPVTPQEPTAAIPTTPVAAPSAEETVAPPVQPQVASTPVPEVAGLTPETKKRRQAAAKKPTPAPVVAEATASPALDSAWVSSADPEDVDIWKGTHDAHAKRNGKNPEDTYVGQVLRGITPTVAPTADDGAFAEKMRLRIPEAQTTAAAQPGAAATPVVSTDTTAPTTETAPVTPAPKQKPKSKLVIKQEKAAAARDTARVEAEAAAKADEERTAAKIPSDADFTMAGMSPGEIALAKKTKPQDVFDAVNRGEISTPQGMRPVTDADIAAAKTRPEKEKLTRLKAKYERATDARRVLTADEVRNVDREAIAAAYVRIQAIANKPGMKQHEAIVADPKSSGSILQQKAGAMAVPTTSAELAKKLEDTYVDNYKRNHPEVAEDFAPAAAGNSRGKKWGGVTNARAALLAMISGRTQASAENVGLANSIKAVPSIQNTNVVVLTAEQAKASDSILRKDNGSIAAGVYDVTTDTVYIAETATSETVLHEVYHAATVKAAAAVEQGTVTTPDAVRALANLKAAVTAISEIDTSALPQDIAAYIAYAGKNVKEALAVLFSRPDVAQAMRDSGVTVPVQVSRTTKTPVKMPLLKAFAHSIAKLLGASGFTQQYTDTTETVIENMLLADVILDSGKELEKIDTRSMPSRSLAKGREGIRNTGTDGKRGATDTADFAPAAKPLTDTEEGISSLNRVGDAIVGLIRNRGIASQDAQDMIESRSGIIEAMRVEGESAIEQVKQEMVDALSGASNATKEAYKVNVLKYLHGDTTVPLPASLKKRIAELRKLIDDRSLAMIAMGLVPKDKIKTVLQNIGKWTHRDFKVFNLQPGRNNHPGEYKKLVMKLAKQGRRDIVKEVIGDIVDAMRVPDAATLKALVASSKDKNAKDHEDAKATLDTWARRWRLASTLSEKEVIARLLEISKMSEADLKKNAAEYANYLLDPEHENAPAEVKDDFNRFKALYADDTALTKDRTQIPPWLKTLWGEYTDWETVSVLSLENQAQILTKFTTLSRYKARLLAKNKAFKSDANRSKVGFTLLEGKTYGPLNGYYIPNADLWLIQASSTVNALDVALGERERGGKSLQATARRVAAGVVDVTSNIGAPFKVAAVLMNHTTVLINAAVSAVMLAGTVPRLRSSLKAIPNGFKIARASSYADVGVRTSRTGPAKGVGMIGRALENGTELQRQLLFLAANNVLHDAALSADMKRKQQEQLTQEVDAMLNFSARLAKYYANPFHYYRYMKDRTSRLNSAGDEFGKYIMWASRVENLMAIDPSMPQQEAELIAAKQTVATMPSFLKSMPLARVISNTGLIDPFLTFNTEQLRNIYNSAAIAVEYGLGKRGRAAKMYAASEAVSILVRLGAISGYNAVVAAPFLAMMQVASDMLDGGGDDDDEDKKKKEEEQIAAGMKWNTGEKYEAIRAAMPAYVHGGVQILRDLGDGKYVFTSGQRFDPGIAGSLLEAAMHEDDGAFEAVLKDTFFQLTPTLPGLANLSSGAVDWLAADPGSDARVRATDEMWSGIKKLGDSYTPGSWKTLTRADKAMEQGVELTTREKILNNIGMTVQVFDSRKAASRIAADYNSVQRDAMRGVKDAMEDKAETLDFHAATLRKLALWERAKGKVDNLKAMGMDFGTVWDAVKNDPISDGINKKELVGLYEGTFPIPDYIEVVGNSRKTALVKAGNKVEEVEARYESYLKQADEAEQQMRAILESQGVQVQ